MSNGRSNVLIACNSRVRQEYLDKGDLGRLEQFADWDWFECEGGDIYDTNEDLETAAQLGERLANFDGLVVCHGCPTLTGDVLDKAPRLKLSANWRVIASQAASTWKRPGNVTSAR